MFTVKLYTHMIGSIAGYRKDLGTTSRLLGSRRLFTISPYVGINKSSSPALRWNSKLPAVVEVSFSLFLSLESKPNNECSCI